MKVPPLLGSASFERIRKEMLEACRKVARRRGLVVEDAGMLEGEIGLYAEFAIRISVPDAEGQAFDPNQELFAMLAENFGLSPDDYGRSFTMGTERFRITGIEPRRHRYPISVERLPDRRKFKFTADNVRAALDTQSTL